jgi:rSAM/selenodomain-associated transferase 1
MISKADATLGPALAQTRLKESRRKGQQLRTKVNTFAPPAIVFAFGRGTRVVITKHLPHTSHRKAGVPRAVIQKQKTKKPIPRLEKSLSDSVKNSQRPHIITHRILSPAIPDLGARGKCALAIMTKAPLAGAVKTRLTPPLTPEEAAALNACFLCDLARTISEVGGGTQGIACYTPVGAEGSYSDILPPEFQLIAQRPEQLSGRLIAATEDLLSVGFRSVCLINSDSPTVPASSFAEAAKILARPGQKLVLGPADDGGYYLIGLKDLHRRIFEGIDWSTRHVLEQTLTRAAELRLEVHLLPTGYDVDDHATLCRLCRDLLGSNETGAAAPATKEFLRTMAARENLERLWPGGPTPA